MVMGSDIKSTCKLVTIHKFTLTIVHQMTRAGCWETKQLDIVYESKHARNFMRQRVTENCYWPLIKLQKLENSDAVSIDTASLF